MATESHQYATVKTKVVKASNYEDSSGKESQLSALDMLMAPIRFQLCFFYSYKVQNQAIERALVQLLNRYPEFSGR